MVRLLELRRGAFISVKHNNAAYAKKWWLAQLYTHVYADSKQVGGLFYHFYCPTSESGNWQFENWLI